MLDASALVKLWVGGDVAAKTVAEHIANNDNEVWAPLHFKIETAQAIRKLYLRKQLSRDQVGQSLSELADFEVTSLPTEHLLAGVARYLDNATAYDAAYVALAELLECPLITADRRLADIPGIRAKVLVV